MSFAVLWTQQMYGIVSTCRVGAYSLYAAKTSMKVIKVSLFGQNQLACIPALPPRWFFIWTDNNCILRLLETTNP